MAARILFGAGLLALPALAEVFLGEVPALRAKDVGFTQRWGELTEAQRLKLRSKAGWKWKFPQEPAAYRDWQEQRTEEIQDLYHYQERLDNWSVAVVRVSCGNRLWWTPVAVLQSVRSARTMCCVRARKTCHTVRVQYTQIRSVKNFTELGFAVAQAPVDVHERLKQRLHQAMEQGTVRPEMGGKPQV